MKDCDVGGGSGLVQFVSADGIYIGATKKTYFKQTEYIKTTEGVSTTVSGVCSSGTSTDCDSYDGIEPSRGRHSSWRYQRRVFTSLTTTDQLFNIVMSTCRILHGSNAFL